MRFKSYKLEDILEKVIDNRGKTPPTVDAGVPLIQSFMLGKGNRYPLVNDKTKFVSIDTYNTWFRSGHPEKGDVLIAVNGSIGEVSIVDKKKYSIAQDLIGLRFDKTLCSPKYMYYLMISNYMKEVYSRLNNGATRPSIRVPHLMGYEIEIIKSIEEQKSIANILSSLDDKIEINNKINKNLEELAQTLYKRWFVDFEFPNEDGEPYKSSGGEMVESELGLIPEGWDITNFSTIINIYSGKRPPKKVKERDSKYEIPVLGASGIMAYTNDYNIQSEVLVIGRVGTHGVVQRINEKVWSSDNTLIIESQKYYFSYQILMSIDYKSLNRGSTQPLITQTDIKKVDIVKPNNVLVENYEEICRNAFNVINSNNIQNNILCEFRNELLPKLMNGEIEVPIEE
ncbi:restriction endonuclease subunit S [Hujiaoplasma nucleasis]|uniref:Restriction endonuclease subunit S n=1 Tax=Hujiaoplasma nucleasis TaxID=2725268 RepID=A0A7L6N574_9MOLU|nr:restriction endonuclease subunit S [Hujiaoplasma nucleasis]QLY40642.1 restriction endonuclease subunit S [Hujiaoplasma nucleasis]